LAELQEMLLKLKQANPVAGQVAEVVRYYEPILEKVHMEDAQKRKDDLDRFVALSENFSSRAQMLQDLALDPLDLTAVDTDASMKDEAPLVLSTIHSAKGLEFDTVFLIQSLDGILPSAFSLERPEELDEELRLLYVALTRAENRLFVSYPVLQQRPRFGDYFSKPSRFLDGVPEQLLEPWTLIEEQASESKE
jgi:DNA helicase-2/ATP-dependent DNA helicase PcrA